MNGSTNGAATHGSQGLGLNGNGFTSPDRTGEGGGGMGNVGADLSNMSPDEANRIIHSHRKVRYGVLCCFMYHFSFLYLISKHVANFPTALSSYRFGSGFGLLSLE